MTVSNRTRDLYYQSWNHGYHPLSMKFQVEEDRSREQRKKKKDITHIVQKKACFEATNLRWR